MVDRQAVLLFEQDTVWAASLVARCCCTNSTNNFTSTKWNIVRKGRCVLCLQFTWHEQSLTENNNWLEAELRYLPPQLARIYFISIAKRSRFSHY